MLQTCCDYPMKMTPYQVNVAGEAFAAALFSQAGYDVAMQYGTKQPVWDLIATKGRRMLKVSVKGSQDGGWGLFQGYLVKADYHGAIDTWLQQQPRDIVYLFVQFKDVEVGGAPRCYLALPKEIAKHMHATRAGQSYTSLRERHSYSRGIGKGHVDEIPDSWRATRKRVDAP